LTPEETAQRLRARLADLGYPVRPATIGAIPTTVSRRRVTHWPTLTSIHTFVAVGHTDDGRGSEAAGYTSAVLDYACGHKGGLPRGLQTGVLAVAFLVVPVTEEGGRELAHAAATR
jgi:hypothetical protein